MSVKGPLVGGPRFAAGNIGGKIRILAQQTWESPHLGDYDRFLAITAAIGEAP